MAAPRGHPKVVPTLGLGETNPTPAGARADCSAVTLLILSGKAGGGETEAGSPLHQLGLTVGPEGTPASLQPGSVPPVSAVVSWPRLRSESAQ